MFLTIVIIILGFSFLVIAHELGHFLAAKWSGMKVEEFGIGFPPKLFSYKPKKSETEYSFNWIPFGGFVRIKGEDEVLEDGQKPSERSFKSKNVWKRMFVIIAGVLVNLLVAIVIFGLMYATGAPVSGVKSTDNTIRDHKIIIMDVVQGSPAEEAGLEREDIIENVCSSGSSPKSIGDLGEFNDFISRNYGQEIELDIVHKGKNKIVKVIPRENPSEGEGALGIAFDRIGIKTFPWKTAVIEGARTSWLTTKLMVVFLKDLAVHLFTKGKVLEGVGGPVMVVSESIKFVKMGTPYALYLLAFISLNLFLINLLPIPALDGGRLLFLIIEGVKGSPVSQKIEQQLHIIGFWMLILLMVLVTARDVFRLF